MRRRVDVAGSVLIEHAGHGLGRTQCRLGVALLVAVLLRTAYGYVVAFAAQMREVSDTVNAVSSSVRIATVAVFLVADLLGLVVSLRATRRPAPVAAVSAPQRS